MRTSQIVTSVIVTVVAVNHFEIKTVANRLINKHLEDIIKRFVTKFC